MALKDSNPRVRKSGVTGCGKVFQHSPSVVNENGLVDTLYQQIKDTDPTVLTFTLQTLNFILSDEGGIVINNNMARYLVKRSGDFPEMELCFVFEYLQKYFASSPNAKDEVRLLILNSLDPYLESKNGPVFLSAMCLFYTTAVGLVESSADQESKLIPDFLAKVKPQMTKFMKSTSQPQVQEFQVQLLDGLIGINAEQLAAVMSGQNLLDFHLKPKDLHFLKRKKIEVLRHVANEENSEEILKYFITIMKSDATVRDDALSTLFDVGSKFNIKIVIKELVTLLDESLELFAPILIRHSRRIPFDKAATEDTSKIVNVICNHLVEKDTDLTDREALSNMLWILNRHCGVMPNSPYILEALHNDHQEDFIKFDLLGSLTVTAIRVFIKYPPATQHSLGEILEMCYERGNPDVRNKVDFYMDMLKNENLSKVLL